MKITDFVCLCMIVTSCGGMFKSKSTDVDSSFYLNNNIQYGDSASELAAKGIASPSIESAGWYNLKDKTFEGVYFDHATANLDENNLICGLTYGIWGENEKAMQNKSDSLTIACFKKYGKPTKDTIYIEEETLISTERCHEIHWINKNKNIAVRIYNSEYHINTHNNYGIIADISLKEDVVKKFRTQKDKKE